MIKFDYIHFDTIDSTNNYAKIMANQTDKNIAIVADIQTAGRTTKNDNWYSPKGNLYLTLMVNMNDLKEQYLYRLSFITALSIVETIKNLKLRNNIIQIKWPNDILLNVKKLCGILIEKEKNFAIIGIGLNLFTSPPRNMTRYPTTSLFENNIEYDFSKFLDDLILNFSSNFEFYSDENFHTIIEKIKPFMYKFNQKIYFESSKNNYYGTFKEIGKNGSIGIEIDNKTEYFLSGELTKDNF